MWPAYLSVYILTMEICFRLEDSYCWIHPSARSLNLEGKLDIIVMGTITGAPLLPFCVLVTQA